LLNSAGISGTQLQTYGNGYNVYYNSSIRQTIISAAELIHCRAAVFITEGAPDVEDETSLPILDLSQNYPNRLIQVQLYNYKVPVRDKLLYKCLLFWEESSKH
jgi:hypothetical protein